mgnify:CR=1 FL=1
MIKKFIILASLLLAPTWLIAGEVVGKIQSISLNSKVIQYLNPKTKEVTIIKFTDTTELIDAESFKDLTEDTKFKATIDKNNVASKITRILVKLPENLVIDTDTLSDLLDQGEPVFIGDARPLGIYNVGHIPTSKSTPADQLKANMHWLPEDKNTFIVFFCGGVTCPLSPAAQKIAMEAGYKNVKAYVEGFPAWKDAVYPSHVNAQWLSNNLDKHHIILDVRQQPTESVKGAIGLSAEKLATMHQQMNNDKVAVSERSIFNLRDKKAPIIIVADTADSDSAIEAYEILTFWKFNNAAILREGMNGWLTAKLPTDKVASELVYEKKLAKGAIDEASFVKAAKEGSAIIIDVRDPEEVSHGKIKGSINIPLAELDQHLDKIPKDGLVILHCLGGSRASLGYTLLMKKGYNNVKYLNDSFSEIAKENGIELMM